MGNSAIFFTLLLLLISFGIAYLNARHTLGTGPAKTNLLSASIFIAGCILILFIIRKSVPESWEMQPITVTDSLFIMFVWFFYFRWFWLTKRAGKMLRNLGRLKFDKLGILLGLLAFLNGWFYLNRQVEMNELKQEEIVRIISILSFGIVTLVSGLMGTRIFEKGLISMGRFMAWDKIESYRWEIDKVNTLTVELGNRLPLFRKVSLPIPADEKDAVDQLLKENISRMTETPEI